MKLFVRKTGIIFLIIISFLFLTTGLNRALIKFYHPFEINESINKVILGDSHTKYALDDKILTSTCNFSQDADSYFYSYVKLKQIIHRNSQIDTVLLSFSQHNIHECIDTLWILNGAHQNERMKFYLPIFDIDDFFFLSKNGPKELIRGFFSQIQLFIYLQTKGRAVYGGYQNLEHNILIEEIEKQKINGIRMEYKSFSESSIEKEYLIKIIEYCKTNLITLILINPPLHRTLQDKQDYLYHFYEENFSNTPFYDFSKIEMDDSYFGDLVHLTPIGAKHFSQLVEDQKLLNSSNGRAYNSE